MTDTATGPAPQRPVRSTGRSRPVRLLGRHVSGVAERLQRGYLDKRPDAIAALARLRHAVNTEPGAVGLPDAIWLPDELIDDIKDRTDHPPAVERAFDEAERALHTAVTLFAVHQQSQRDQRMHTPGTPFATAVQRLAGESANDASVHRRFTAMGTAVHYRELVHHARGLITQLRGAKLGFDYGLFADDLRLFQRERPLPNGLTGAEQVRDHWGREYWRAWTGPDRGAGTGPEARPAAAGDPA